MTGKEVIETLNDQGINVAIQNSSIKLSGCVTNEHRNLVKANKQLVIEELQKGAEPEFLTSEQQVKQLVTWGYEQELAELIVWAWENDQKWPIEPFYLQTSLRAEPFVVGNPKAFYHSIGISINDPVEGGINRQDLKAILGGLKALVEEQQRELVTA